MVPLCLIRGTSLSGTNTKQSVAINSSDLRSYLVVTSQEDTIKVLLQHDLSDMMSLRQKGHQTLKDYMRNCDVR